MSNSVRTFCGGVVVLGMLALSGCGAVQQARIAAERTQRMNDFKIMALQFHNYSDAHKQGPSDWQGLLEFVESNPQTSATLQRLQSEGVVFFCEQQFKDARAGTSNSIFAYEANAPQSGGVVALMDGSVRFMTPEEFATMLENQTKMAPETVAKKSS